MAQTGNSLCNKTIDESIIPEENQLYSDSNFWEKRYSDQLELNREIKVTRDWLGCYSMFASMFRLHVKKSASILVLGCGNSLLSEELFDDGYRNLHNIDISSSVIRAMSSHCDKCRQMQWHTMDCRSLNFAESTFDVVLEKATIEVFMVGEKSPWNVSEPTLNNIEQMANEITRVLRPSHGQFFSISFTAPHFRLPLFNRVFQDQMKTANFAQLGDHFHYYFYRLTNDPAIQSISFFSYEPAKMTQICDTQTGCDDENPNDIFLHRIQL